MEHIQIHTKERNYEVLLGHNILPNLTNELKRVVPNCQKLFLLLILLCLIYILRK